MAYINSSQGSLLHKSHLTSSNAQSAKMAMREQNYFKALESAIEDHDPELARRFREKMTPQMARKLGDLEKSRQALESSLNDVRQMKKEQKEKAQDSGMQQDKNHQARMYKMDHMISKTHQSLKLNKQSREELMDWLLDGRTPHHIIEPEKITAG